MALENSQTMQIGTDTYQKDTYRGTAAATTTTTTTTTTITTTTVVGSLSGAVKVY